ncbi:MAG: ATP-binding cassette domain-containing protein [Rhodospirillaceae bacterium]
MFALSHVSKTFGRTAAVRDLDLPIAGGATTVLIGPSGCGKSTLLRLLNGLLTPDSGTVSFDGEELSPANVLPFRRRMGYVIQDGGLFPHLTAVGNVSLMARHLGWDRERIDARLSDLCDLTRFPPDGLGRYPAELSGGQRQRVGLMRALMLDPDALLLDEPLGALDPMIRYDLQRDLREIFRRLRKTVVLVTHDLGEAGFLGDEIVLLRDGAIVQRGDMQALLAAPADGFVERFVRAQRGPTAGGNSL